MQSEVSFEGNGVPPMTICSILGKNREEIQRDDVLQLIIVLGLTEINLIYIGIDG